MQRLYISRSSCKTVFSIVPNPTYFLLLISARRSVRFQGKQSVSSLLCHCHLVQVRANLLLCFEKVVRVPFVVAFPIILLSLMIEFGRNENSHF